MKNKIKVEKLKIIRNNKGDILKYVSIKNKNLKKFGEIYFTEIKKNKIKGWNFHKKNTCLITVPFGKVKFTFVNNFHKIKKYTLILGRKNYRMVVVPPRTYFKFTSISNISLVVNTMNFIHNDNETLKIPLNEINENL